MIDLKTLLGPTGTTAVRLVNTKAKITGWRDHDEFVDRQRALARMAAQPVPPASGPPVLFFSFHGWYPHAAWEAVLAHAMRLRGIPVHVFNCGGELPVCEVNFRGAAPAIACRECAVYPGMLIDRLAMTRTWLRDYVVAEEQDAIDRAVAGVDADAYEAFEWDKQPVGRLVHDSVLWFLRKSTVDGPADREVYRRFLAAGASLVVAAPRILDRVQPRAILQLNGRFFAEQVLNQFVPDHVPVVTYECGWRSNTLGFDRLSAAGAIDLDDAWRRWKDRELTVAEDTALDQWLASRESGDMQRDFYIDFRKTPASDPLRALGLDPTRPTAVLFTNLVWDTAVLGKDDAFRSIREWLFEAVGEFSARPDWQLVIRVHPAEELRPSQPSVERLASAVRDLGPLPQNIKLVAPTDRVSSYALMRRCRATLVYTSTTGLEAALRQKPVVVGARVYYRGRGFTRDVASREDFSAALGDVMGGHDPAHEQQTLARRFAFLLLFRYLKRIPVVRQRPGTFPRLDPDEVDALLPGHNQALDALISAIVAGGPFV